MRLLSIIFLAKSKGPDPDQLMWGIAILVVLFIAQLIAMAWQQKKLDDPNDPSVLHFAQLETVSLLGGPGLFLVRTLRQSGNLQQSDRVFQTPQAAIAAAVSTFKRAKIEYLVIVKNTPDCLSFRRPYWNHRGSSEGKKVGAIEIHRVPER